MTRTLTTTSHVHLTKEHDMIRSAKETLSEKKGIAEALGIMAVVMMLLVAAGVMLTNYSIHSKKAAQLVALSQEITNRAELYAATLNEDLLAEQVPSTARECSTTTAMCTQIIGMTPAADGTKTVLRIQGDTAAMFGESLTKDVTLVSEKVSHVTAIDEIGNNVWALSDEGLRFTAWSVAEGKPKTITEDDISMPSEGVTWVSIDDRAGVDSTGRLWVWGKNDIGQAGVGTKTTTPIAPTTTEATTGATKFRYVYTADDRAYAIDSTGIAWVWGKNDKGQLGRGNTTATLKPTKISGTRFLKFAIGKDNVFAITMAGDLVVAGAAPEGFPAYTDLKWHTLNAGTTYRDVATTTTEATVALIDSAGALTLTGNTYAWTPHSGGYSDVTVGPGYGFAIGGSGTLYAWGENSSGQLGLGDATDRTAVTQVSIATKFVSAQAGANGALIVDREGQLYYTGKMPAGVVGKNLPQVNKLTKLLPDVDFREITLDSAGTAAGALRDTAGNIYGMGTSTPGLWKITYSGDGMQPIRMPVPDGFYSYTWE